MRAFRLQVRTARAVLAAALLTLVLFGPESAGVAASGASSRGRGHRIVNGWLAPWATPAGLASAVRNADLWSEVSPFWYEATGPTTIVLRKGAGDPAVIAALRRHGLTVIPTVTETLDSTALARMLNDPAQRAAHVRTLVELVTGNGYDGIDLDYETMAWQGNPADRPAAGRGFVRLLADLGPALHRHGKLLTVAVGARTGPFARNWAVHDYAAIAPLVDRLRLMTYDYHSPGSTPGPIAPLWWVEAVASYALTVAPPGKVELGVPLYGYDWPADPRRPGGWGTATSLTYQKAEALRARYHATRHWSSVDAAPWFTYTAKGGVRHVVWYNDAASTSAKLALVGTYRLRGVALWVVGAEDARLWPAVRAFAGPPATPPGR